MRLVDRARAWSHFGGPSGADTGIELADLRTLDATNAGLACNHYTYFIVPFGYELTDAGAEAGPSYREDPTKASYLPGLLDPRPAAGDDGSAHWQEALTSRYRYLLPETHLTLFDGARWFRLSGGARDAAHGELAYQDSLSGQSEARRITLGFSAAAELVLFEWERALHAPRGGVLDAVGLLLLVVVLDCGEAGRPPRLADLLDLNERLRYLDRPYGATRSFLSLPDWGIPSDADRDDYWVQRWEPLIERAVVLDGEQRCIKVARHALSALGSKQPSHPGGYPDDRAFVFTFACVSGTTALTPLNDQGESSREPWKDVWHALVDVDGRARLGQGISGDEQRWLAERTYTRWREQGTVYGFTDFSAALLMLKDGTGPFFSEVPHHFRLMYLDQLLLLLYERTTLHRFSARISEVSAAHGRGRRSLQSFRLLRERFTLLTNLYQFPMFTAQYQGRDLYRLARANLEIDRLYDEVKTEIGATDEFLTQRATEQLDRRLWLIQFVGFPIVLLGLGLTAAAALFALLQLETAKGGTAALRGYLPSIVTPHWVAQALAVTSAVAVLAALLLLLVLAGAWLLGRWRNRA